MLQVQKRLVAQFSYFSSLTILELAIIPFSHILQHQRAAEGTSEVVRILV